MKKDIGIIPDIRAIIIVTADADQKPNETRLDLVNKNVAVYKSIIPEIVKYGFRGILLIVSNPVDILAYAAVKLSAFPENRVIGSGTVLDAFFYFVLFFLSYFVSLFRFSRRRADVHRTSCAPHFFLCQGS